MSARSDNWFGMSDREQAIVELMAAHGLTNKEIAHRLGLPLQTVKNAFSRIFKAFGCHEGDVSKKRITVVRIVYSVPEWRAHLEKYW
jgi:DNA-binding NarL/FixJ family response regulator